jgi:hypothetical protein
MKLLAIGAAAGVFVVSAALAHGGYFVQLDGGDRMTVDSYWAEGDRVHLIQDGSDLSVPRARIRSIGAVEARRNVVARDREARSPASRPDAK